MGYGARFYDPAIGRFAAIDPLATKNAVTSPYAYVENNPLYYLDPNGMDNVIYLLALKGSSRYANAQKIAAQANKNFSSLGLKTQVHVITDVNKFDASKMDKTDAIAVMGANKNQVVDFIKGNLSNAVESTTAWDNWASPKNAEKLNPESSPSYYKNGNKGNLIAIDASQFKKWSAVVKDTPVNGAALIINHGAGHLAGLGHSDGSESVGDYLNGGPVMYSGNSIGGFIHAYSRGKDYHGVSYNTINICPNNCSDFSTGPTEQWFERMHERFGNNSPKVTIE